MDLTQAKHISKEERQRRKDNDLCGYCGAKDHWIKDCLILPLEGKTPTYPKKHLGNLDHDNNDQGNVEFYMGKD